MELTCVITTVTSAQKLVTFFLHHLYIYGQYVYEHISVVNE